MSAVANPSPCYNSIYDKLVEGEGDLVGAFAYCFYKEQKRAFCEQIRTDHAREPNQAELSTFYLTSCVPQSIAAYRDRGEKLVNAFLQTYLSEAPERS